MTSRTLAFTAVALLLAACASADDAEPAVTPTATTPPTTSSLPTAPTSAPPPSSTPPVPETTVPEVPAAPANYDAVFGSPASDLLEALPPAEIPWDSVGPGWLAFTHPRAFSTAGTALDQLGLYLLGRDDEVFAVSALPSDGTDVVSASWAGRVALLRGPYADGLPLGVLDLETTGFRTVVPDGEDLDVVSLTRDGSGLWVYDLPWSNPPQPGGSIRVSRVNVDDGSWATIYDEPVVVDDLSQYYNWWVNNRGGIVEMPNGDIVFGTPGGLLIGPADGSAFRRLEAPGDACAIVGAWDDETIQVRCQLPDPPLGCDCGPAGLWLVPTDGSGGRALAIPEVGSCTSYSRATPLGDDLAISAGFGSGECNSGVLLDLGDGLDAWVPPISEVDCNEVLLGTRNDAWLVAASNPYVGFDYPVRTFEVTPTDSWALPIPDSWVVPLQP